MKSWGWSNVSTSLWSSCGNFRPSGLGLHAGCCLWTGSLLCIRVDVGGCFRHFFVDILVGMGQDQTSFPVTASPHATFVFCNLRQFPPKWPQEEQEHEEPHSDGVARAISPQRARWKKSSIAKNGWALASNDGVILGIWLVKFQGGKVDFIQLFVFFLLGGRLKHQIRSFSSRFRRKYVSIV